MRVKAMWSDETGCGSYRIIWPARALEVAGFDVVAEPLGLHGFFDVDHPEDAYDYLPVDCDVLVIQRPLNRDIAALIPLLQRDGVAVVVDIDDHFHACDQRNAAWVSFHPSRSPHSNFHHLARACELADLVTVTTPALARQYAKHGRYAILPNCVPERFLTVGRPPSARPVVMGWPGYTGTHPGDLRVMGGAVARVQAKTHVPFRVVGPPGDARRQLGVMVQSTGFVPFGAYPEAVAQLSVGVVPLVASAFNEAKSWLKGLELAACGVPFVASDLPEYRRLARHGIGETAAKPKDFEHKLLRLVTDHDYRIEQAELQRAAAASWTYERNAERWWEAWTAAHDRRVTA